MTVTVKSERWGINLKQKSSKKRRERDKVAAELSLQTSRKVIALQKAGLGPESGHLTSPTIIIMITRRPAPGDKHFKALARLVRQETGRPQD